MVTRRKFVSGAVPFGILALGSARIASAQLPRLEERDPAAAALGYHARRIQSECQDISCLRCWQKLWHLPVVSR